MEKLVVYVDGSYNKDTKVYGYGMVIITDSNISYKKGCGIDTEGVWNIAGEVAGATKAIEYALENGCDELTICHDYEGIQKWADSEWKAKKKISGDYVKCVNDARSSGLTINFRWIKGHSGDPYNEQADRLAKEAVSKMPKGFIFGKSGEGHAFTVDTANQGTREDLEMKYGKTYRDYAEDIVNQIMEYAKSTCKAYPHHFTVQVLAEALHQITEDKVNI